MKSRKIGDTVRRNVTLGRFAADNLEALADFTGYSQGELLTKALNQPIMRRFYAFAHAEHVNPLTELLETYQADEGHMTPRIGEYIIQATKNWFENHATMLGERLLSKKCSHLNSYIRGHITGWTKEISPYMLQVYEEAGDDRFITPGMGADEVKEKVIKIMDIMLAEPNNKYLMGESYMFRCLEVILIDCFEPPRMQEIIELFKELSDGYVLPYFDTSPEFIPEEPMGV